MCKSVEHGKYFFPVISLAKMGRQSLRSILDRQSLRSILDPCMYKGKVPWVW